MEYKISDVTNFKGTAPGNQWTSEYLSIVVLKLSSDAFSIIVTKTSGLQSCSSVWKSSKWQSLKQNQYCPAD